MHRMKAIENKKKQIYLGYMYRIKGKLNYKNELDVLDN